MPSKIQDIVSLEEETLIGQWISLRCNFLVDVEGASSWWVDEQAWWYTPLIPALRRHKQVGLCESRIWGQFGLHNEFQDRLGNVERHFLKNQKHHHQQRTSKYYFLLQPGLWACAVTSGLNLSQVVLYLHLKLRLCWERWHTPAVLALERWWQDNQERKAGLNHQTLVLTKT